MIEAEFRDWTRGQLRALDERIKALAALPAPPAAKETLERITKANIEQLAATLQVAVKEAEVTGLAIVFMTADGPHTGYVPGDEAFRLAGAATFMGLEILEEFRKAEAANDQPSGGAGEDQKTT